MNRSTKIMLFALGAVLAVAAVAMFTGRRKRQETALDTVGGVVGCITVPDTMTRWTGTFAQTDWWAYKKAIQDLLGEDPENESTRSVVDGFFKAIDLEPTSRHVRYFQKDLKVWMRSIQAAPHWDVQQGFLKCK